MSGHDSQRLSAFLDGELSKDEEGGVRSHVQACPECQALLATLRRVDEEARARPAGEPPDGYFDDFARRVGARIEAKTGPRAGRAPSRVRWPLWAGAAAAALVLAVLVPRTLERGAPAPVGEQRLERLEEMPAAASSLADDARRDDAARVEPDQPVTRALEAARDRPPTRTLPPAPTPGPEPAAGGEGAPSSPPAALAPRVLEKKEAASAAGAANEREGFATAPSREDRAPEEPLEEARMSADREREDRDLSALHQRARAAFPESAPPPAPVIADDEPAEADVGSREAPGAVAAQASAAPSPDVATFDRLQARTPTTAEGWRESREAWRTWAATYRDSPRADEARVRVIEDGVAAWRAGDRDEDLERARADLAAYLARTDARQKDRARRAVAEAGAR